ncbi:hypothetical protein FHT12_000409 [Xanthomonas campestris]|nr:hypothetical protein [Xanthomonas euroxanthea]
MQALRRAGVRMLCADSGPGPRPSAVAQSLSGMDAVQEPRSTQEPTSTYLRRVPRRRAGKGPAAHSQRRGRGALTACGTRRESIPGGSVAASMPPHGPATGKGTAPDNWSALIRKAVCRTVRIGRGAAAHDQTWRFQHCSSHAHRPSRLVLARSPSRDPERHGCRAGAYMDVLAACPARVGGQGPCSKLTASSARCPHRSRDTP